MERAKSLKLIDELLSNARKNKLEDSSVHNALKLISITALYPSYYYSETITEEELSLKKNKKKKLKHNEEDIEENRIRQVVDIYDVMCTTVLSRNKSLGQIFAIGTNITQLLVWICNFYPLLLYGSDSTASHNYKQNMRNILHMIRFMYKFNTNIDHKSERLKLMIQEMHLLLSDLYLVWIHFQNIAASKENNSNAVFIELFPQTRKLILGDNATAVVCSQLRVSSIGDCQRYMNATTTLLSYLANNNKLQSDNIPHLFHSNALEGVFLTSNRQVFELLIAIIKTGNAVAKTNTMEYLSVLVRINQWYILTSSQSLIVQLISNECIAPILHDHLNSDKWPEYRIESFDDRLANLITNIDIDNKLLDRLATTSGSSLIDILKWNIEHSSSRTLCNTLVDRFYIYLKRQRANTVNTLILFEKGNEELIGQIFNRGLMTSDLLVCILSLCINTSTGRTVSIESNGPIRKRQKLESTTVSTVNAFGMIDACIDDQLKSLLFSIEKYLTSIINIDNINNNRDLVVTIEAIMKYVWRDFDFEDTDVEMDVPNFTEVLTLDLNRCTILHSIVDFICTQMREQLTSSNNNVSIVVKFFLKILEAYTQQPNAITNHTCENKRELLFARYIASNVVQPKLISMVLDVLSACDNKTFVIPAPPATTETTSSHSNRIVTLQDIRNCCMKFLCTCYSYNPDSSESENFEKWFTKEAIYHYDLDTRLLYSAYMHCIVEGKNRHELIVVTDRTNNRSKHKTKALAHDLLIYLKSLLKTDPLPMSTLEVFAKEFGAIAPFALPHLEDNYLKELLSTMFKYFLAKTSSDSVVCAFLESLPNIYHSVSNSQIWTNFESQLKSVIRMIAQPSSTQQKSLVINTTLLEDLLIGGKKRSTVMCHFLDMCYKENGAYQFIVRLHNQLKNYMGDSNTNSIDNAKTILCLIAKVGFAVTNYQLTGGEENSSSSSSSKSIDLLKHVLFALKDALYCGVWEVEAQAVDYIDLIRKRNKCSQISEILPVDDLLFDEWMIQILTSDEYGDNVERNNILKSVSHVLYETSSLEFCKRLQKRIIPKLVEKQSKDAIVFYSKVVQTLFEELWSSMFPYAVAHLLTRGQLTAATTTTNTAALKFIGELGQNRSLSEMLRNNEIYIMSVLCLQLKVQNNNGTDEANCLSILKNFYQFFSEKLEIPIDVLKQRCFTPALEILKDEITYYSTGTWKETLMLVPDRSPIMVIKCLKCLLVSMGSTCKYFTSNVISLLKNDILDQYAEAANFKELLSGVCDVWSAFVKSLDDEKLADVLAQMVVQLLPYVEIEPKALNVLHYLIVDKREATEHLFDYLPAFPDVPALKSIRKIIPDIEAIPSNTPNGIHLVFERKLRRAINGIKHESLAVQRISAQQLKSAIEDHYEIISDWIDNAVLYDMNHVDTTTTNASTSNSSTSGRSKNKNNSSSSDTTIVGENHSELISELIVLLVQKCASAPRADRSDDRGYYAECLGLIGAIDPSRLSLEKLYSEQKAEMNDVDLGFTIIDSHLCMHLKAATEDHKIAAFCIQELLKFLRNKSNSTGVSKNELTTLAWWNRFDKNKQEDLMPLLHSSFITKMSNQTKPFSIPIYKQGTSYRRWMTTFCKYLTERAPDGSRSSIFKCLRPAFARFIPLSQFVLPYMVQNMVMNGTDENRNDITNEFVFILQSAFGENNSENADVTLHEVLPTAISILDNLTTWLRNHKSSSSSTTTSRKSSTTVTEIATQYSHLERFLNTIPQDLLAKAAFTNGAYTRALLYYETYLRSAIAQYQQSRKIREVHLPIHTPDRAALFNDFMLTDKKAKPLLFLQSIYKSLDMDLDALQGIDSLRTTTSLYEEIIDHEAQGNWNEALHCYELALQQAPNDVNIQLNMLKCNRNLGHLQTMLRTIDGVLTRLDTNNNQFKTYAVQSAWRLEEWDLLEEYLNGAETTDFEADLARALYSYHQKSTSDEFKKLLDDMKRRVIPPLSAACMESYERAYPYIVQFQMIMELEQSYKLLAQHATASVNEKHKLHRKLLSQQWNNRLKLTMDSLDTREPIISQRRTLFSLNDMDKEVGDSWLIYAKLARERKNFSQARSAILQANGFKDQLPHFTMNYAKLLHESGNTNQALTIIENPETINEIKTMQFDGRDESKVNHLIAKMKLLAVNWSEAARKKKTTILKQQYGEIVGMQSEWEEGYFYLAKYLDSLFISRLNASTSSSSNTNTTAAVSPSTSTSSRSRSRPKKVVEPPPETPIESTYLTYVEDIVTNYVHCLKYGVKHIYHALPRLLTLVCNTGDVAADTENIKLADLNSNLLNLLNVEGDVHPSIWMVALSQILSRINHKNENTRAVIREMITCLLTRYPKHVMWSFSRLLHSAVESEKRSEMQAILSKASKTRKSILVNYQTLINGFIKFCALSIGPRELKFYDSQPLKPLKKMLPNTQIMIPLQSAITVDLYYGSDVADADISTLKTIDISAFDEQVKVMTSVAKPRRICMIGSDGKKYPFLVKPKDDLRKDSRFMEFSRTLNRLFMKNPETRRRKLYIRTFSAIALTESAGLVEWVENTAVYKQCVTDGDRTEFYNDNNRSYVAKRLRTAPPTFLDCNYDPDPDILNKERMTKDEAKRKLAPKPQLLREILQDSPAAFYRWFNIKFPEPTKWFQSRSNYVKTCAVMSMVGWVMGLGDRHCENILMDCLNGDLLHIDLNMLFDEGTTLAVRERVPFRLTMNMVDAMGVTGYEGTFRTNCEVTMETLRANKDALMNIVEGFIHDPLLGLNPTLSPLEVIERKLKGLEVVQASSSTTVNATTSTTSNTKRRAPIIDNFGDDEHRVLSVQAQVDQLIANATDEERLSHMWPYWQPWV
jgi:tetratricopeptide (TPR) repeat protein